MNQKKGPAAGNGSGKNRIHENHIQSADPIQALLGMLHCVKKAGVGWTARCPAHDDRTPSLSVSAGNDGRVLLHCHAGCLTQDILEALGLSHKDLFTHSKHTGNGRSHNKITPTFQSVDAITTHLLHFPELLHCKVTQHRYNDSFVVLRFDLPGGSKTFRPIHRTSKGWCMGDPQGKLPLYRARELGNAKTVYVCEGEKAADAGWSIGLPCVTSAHGSKSAKRTDWTPLCGRSVTVLCDNDEPGRQYALTVARILWELGCTVRIVELPGLPEGGDIADVIENVSENQDSMDIAADIKRLVSGTAIWQPSDATPTTQPTDAVPGSRPLWQTIAEIGELPEYRTGFQPVTTGFVGLDSILGGGFRRGSLYIIAGRTGSAKSTFAANIARRVALCGHSVLLLKLEESPTEAVMRMHAAAAQVNLHVLLDGPAAHQSYGEELVDGWELLNTLPIRVSDVRDLGAIGRTCREHVAADGRLVILDQLSMVDVGEPCSAYERASIISNALRLLARDLHVPILAVSQVNREAAKHKKSGQLGANDLRDSGHLENDSAAVMLLDRPPVTVARHKTDPMLIALHVRKNRYGRCTDPENPLLLDWWPWFARIEDRFVGPAENVA